MRNDGHAMSWIASQLIDALDAGPPEEALRWPHIQLFPQGRLELRGRMLPGPLTELLDRLPPWVSALRLIDTAIGPEGAFALADWLKRNPPVWGLDLEGNQLGPHGARALASGLTKCEHLRALFVGRCRLKAEGAMALLGGAERLRTLGLADNAIEAGTLRLLAAALPASVQAIEVGGPRVDARAAEGLLALMDRPSTRALLVPSWTAGEAVAASLLDRLSQRSLFKLELPDGLSAAQSKRKLAWLCAHRNREDPTVVAGIVRDLGLRVAPRAPRHSAPDAVAPPMSYSDEELQTCVRVLEVLRARKSLASERASLSKVRRLVDALYHDGRVPRRARKLRRRAAARAHDEGLLEQSGIRSAASKLLVGGESARTLLRSRRCYVCKSAYFNLHLFYDSLCPACARLNFEKRQQRGDLRGRVALVTGGRIKIGLEVVKILLESGAEVIVTTRFPHDAAQRYARLDIPPGKLHIFGLDLRFLPRVEAFADHVARHWPRLDILIHNAAQTIHRPDSFYENLRPERAQLSEGARALLQTSWSALVPASGTSPLFPAGTDDGHGHPLDLRSENSWRLKAHEVSTPELVEVHLINAMAPFLLSGRLRPLMARTPAEHKFVVNVSAMEGQFQRYYKSEFHPHTNMAKAALNMMTRTSAQDFLKDGIYMTSVDTGWVTNENPFPIAEHMAHAGFSTPLDEIDGAARVLDPVFRGLDPSSPQLLHGVFLKDYELAPW